MDPERFKWIGNPLSRAGVECKVGNLHVELARINPDFFGLPLGKVSLRIRRTWVLNLADDRGKDFGDHAVLASVLIYDVLATEAMVEAERIARWAAAYEFGDA